jgi:hypothetical protein
VQGQAVPRRVCARSPVCDVVLACGAVLAVAAKQARDDKAARVRARADRAKLAEYRERTKTRPQHLADAQKAFNALVRAEDEGKPCISSGVILLSGGVGGGFDAGHYRSVGSAPHLRFDRRNCHGQSKHDNRYLSGNAVAYRRGLIDRIGMEAVEALEADDEPRKFTIEQLKEMTAHYRAELKKLKANGH